MVQKDLYFWSKRIRIYGPYDPCLWSKLIHICRPKGSVSGAQKEPYLGFKRIRICGSKGSVSGVQMDMYPGSKRIRIRGPKGSVSGIKKIRICSLKGPESVHPQSLYILYLLPQCTIPHIPFSISISIFFIILHTFWASLSLFSFVVELVFLISKLVSQLVN